MYNIRKLPSIHYTHSDELYVLSQIEFADKGVTKTQQMQNGLSLSLPTGHYLIIQLSAFLILGTSFWYTG